MTPAWSVEFYKAIELHDWQLIGKFFLEDLSMQVGHSSFEGIEEIESFFIEFDQSYLFNHVVLKFDECNSMCFVSGIATKVRLEDAASSGLIEFAHLIKMDEVHPKKL